MSFRLSTKQMALVAGVSAVLSLGVATPSNAAPAPTPVPSAAARWTLTAEDGSVYQPAASPAASSSTVKPMYNPITIAVCNGGGGETTVANYNSTDNGKVNLLCGTDYKGSGSGYVHIRYKHQKDFQSIIDTYPIGGNWDDLSEYMAKNSLEHPTAGYSKAEPDQKRCYSSSFIIKNDKGVTVKTYHPTVIVSSNNKLVITAFPTSSSPNCTGD